MTSQRIPPGAVKVTPAAAVPPGVVRVSAAPPGAVPVTPAADSRSWFQKYVSAPVTGVAKEMLAHSPVGDVGYLVGGAPGREKAGDVSARLLVPQSGIEAGILGGTLIAGPALAALGKAAPVVGTALRGAGPAARALPTAARITGATAGGAAGGAATGEGAGKGAALGALTSVLGEAVTYGIGKAARSFVGAQSRIAAQDARRLGDAVGDLSHPLRGATTAEELRRLAGGEGQKRLSAAKEAVVRSIDAVARPINVPSLSAQPMMLRAANEQLTEVGKRAFTRGAPYELRQQYRTMADEIVKGLDQGDPTGASSALWREAQGQYSKGLAVLDRLLSRSGAYARGTGEVALNTPVLQRAIADPKVQRVLGQKLTPAEMERLVASLTRGGPLGSMDVVRSLAPTSLRGMLATGALGAPGFLVGPAGAAGAAVPFVLPNVLSTYAGRVPYAVPQAGKLAADVLAARTLSLLEQAQQFRRAQERSPR